MRSKRLHIPSYLESPADRLPPRPPVVTRLQELPFGELAWENFERLCLRLARREADISECFLYGERGQAQRGIDIIGYAGSLPNRQVWVYQCKREKKFSGIKIKTAVEDFLASDWDPKPTRLILCSSVPLRSVAIQNEIALQITKLAKGGIEFQVWDSEAIGERLKGLPELVDDFFGRHWVEAFIGQEAIVRLGARLSGDDVATLRSRLFTLYKTLFDRHDPGLPSSLDQRAPYRQRYVPPDVAEHRPVTFGAEPSPSGVPENGKTRTEGLEFREASPHPGQPGPFRREHPISQREFVMESRGPALRWLPKNRRTVVLGEPGVGKSSLLRFVALTLLDPESPHEDLAREWGERLPLWISFNAWTRTISLNEARSFEDFLFIWLHQHSSDDLRPLFSQALGDGRLLLLIDGLDEQYSEEAAMVGLDRLDAFLAGRDIPVVLTTRPAGYERVRRPSGEWAHGRLLDFNDEQIRALTQFWFYWLELPTGAEDPAVITAAEEAAQRHTEELFVQLAASPRVRDLARVPLLLTLFIELSRFKGRLPEHRIKAYDMMVNHLLTVHPAHRRRAAGITQWVQPIPTDDIKEAMARLAFWIQEVAP